MEMQARRRLIDHPLSYYEPVLEFLLAYEAGEIDYWPGFVSCSFLVEDDIRRTEKVVCLCVCFVSSHGNVSLQLAGISG